MNAQELMVKALKDSGYQETEEHDEDDLGSKEFFVHTTPTQDILCLGSGHAGDDGCKIKFYFVGGILMGHAALEGDGSDD